MTDLTSLLSSNDDRWPCESPIEDPDYIRDHADEFYPREMYYAQAVKLCAGCPVKSGCLEFALANNEEHGIWGGTTPKQREIIKRRRAKDEAAA